MYVQDLAEFARVLLATTEMSFDIGWLRVQLILFCQLAAITGNRLEALVNLRYRHLKLTLIRDPTGQSGSYPRLFIELTAEYTKTFLGIKDKYASLVSTLTDMLWYTDWLRKERISHPRDYLRPNTSAQPSCFPSRHAL